ncbi:lipid IV(A) 4-amino-4-deoxy-L-arabinosyltransferase [Pseudomonas sp. NA-150]|uniref:lipid IV(A) 4-amino-4-deoxy-L-arabinosyltransferase n=1 Tax=Pseudomonas sp. NA-150 TaxID=3367525 RepID=UPI0037C53307
MKPNNLPMRHADHKGLRRQQSLPEVYTPVSSLVQQWVLPLGLLAFLLFYLLPLTFHGLWIPDETRYAQISQEMLKTGNWVSPHFMGLRYFEKPAGGYWMIAIGQALFGENLFGVRVASAVSTGLSVLLTYLIARRLWNDPRKSVACTLLYMSFGLIAGQAGYANIDPQFTLWVNLSLVALWFAVDSSPQRHRLMAWAALGFACGMGFLTKGFLAWLLPVLIALPYMTWQRRLGELLRYGPIAVLFAAIVCLPWVLRVNAQESDFWNFFFWNEHVRRFAADDAQHDRSWWFYLPIMLVSSLPWAALLPSTLVKAWEKKHQADTAFLLLWLVLPLTFFSLSRGKLPTYIMPCLLPLALLIGNTLADKLRQLEGQAIRINGLINAAIAIIALLALIYLQMTNPVYGRTETIGLTLFIIVLAVWIISNALQALRPLTYWAAPALGVWTLVALLPAAMPGHIVSSKMPDQFIAEHLSELNQTTSLLSNDLGAASALSWRLNRPDVDLYNVVGEVKYGITYADAIHRQVDRDKVQRWMTEARKKGSVGVVMRVNSPGETDEIGRLPKDGKRYVRGNMTILIFAQEG